MVVALDLDGTLLDSRRRHVAVARAAVQELGIEMPDLCAYWEAKRNGGTTAELLGPDVARVWGREIEARRWLELDSVFPDVERTVRDMTEAGVRLFILTARRDSGAVRSQVERLRLHLPLEVVDPLDASRQKARILAERGCTVLVGDTESDAQAAAAAGVEFVAVSRGQRSEPFLRAHGVSLILPDLASAWRAIQSMTSSV